MFLTLGMHGSKCIWGLTRVGDSLKPKYPMGDLVIANSSRGTGINFSGVTTF